MGGGRHRSRGRKKNSRNETRNEIRGETRSPKEEIQEIDSLCAKPHRLIVTEKKTKMQYLLATDAQVSLFPKCLISEKSDMNRIEHSDIYVDSTGTLIYTFGQIFLKIDLGLGKDFSWKFTLVDSKRPIIGIDFLSHFHLQINFQRMCLMNLETSLETKRISTVACECHRDVNFDDGWPNITAIFKRLIKHRNHITDKNTKKMFLIGCTSQISVFPKAEVKEEDLESFNNSFDLHGVYGKVARVQGWTTKNLDFGLGREFTWKFAVIDIDKPIIGFDFIQKFSLVQQLKMGYFSLFDSETKIETPAPSGPCDCGNYREGWPKSNFLITKHLKENSELLQDNHEFSKTSPNQNLEESDLNPQHLKQTSTPFNQNSDALKISNECPRVLILSPESSKGNFKPLNQKSKEFDQYPEPFTQNPRTLNNIFGDFVQRNNNNEPLNQFSKESSQYPQPFNQSLKPFKQSSGGLLLVKPIPKPFKQNPELSNKNSEQSKRSPELSSHELSIFRDNLEEETLEVRKKSPEGNKTNFGIINQKSTSPDNEKPKGKLKEQPSENNVNPSKLDDKSNLEQNFRKTKEESESNENSKTLEQEATEEKTINLKNDSEWVEVHQRNKRKQSPERNHLSSSSQVDNFTAKHRFHVVDKKSNMLFLIGTESELSVFPQQEMRGKSMEPFDESFQVSGAFGKKEKVFGWTTQVIDIGVGREFTWKFAVINICKPVLGWDFISHFGFSFHTGGLLDWETHITAPPPTGPCDCGKINDGWPAFVNFVKNEIIENSIQESDSSSDVSSTDESKEFQLATKDCASNKKRSKSPREETFKQESASKDNSQLIFTINEFTSPNQSGSTEESYSPEEFENPMEKENKSRKTKRGPSRCKQIKPSNEMISIEEDSNSTPKAKKKKSARNNRKSSSLDQEKLELETKACEDGSKPKSEGKEPEISSNISIIIHKSDIKHRFHITDKLTKLSFFIDANSEISVFPKSELGDEPLERFGVFYEIINSEGSIIHVYGWITQKLDFGFGIEMSWKFAVIDTDRPVLTVNFPRKFGLKINHKKQIMYNILGRCTRFPSEPCDCRELETTILPSFKIRQVQNEKIKHSFHLEDKNSQMLFFISKSAQVSLFPRCLVQSRSMEASAGSETIDCIRLILPIYGWLTLKVDFGLEREFKWNFAVTDTLRPIVGLDFLKNFGLQTDYSMEYPRLLDQETNLKTSEFRGSCNCENTFDFPVSGILRKSDSVAKQFSVQKKLENNTTRCSNDLCPQEERLILIERETGMPYLLSGATMSVFPKSEAKENEIEPFNDGFDLVQLNGSVVPVHGWIARKLDFGLGRYFSWKFALINTERPMLANDFLHYYNFTVSYKGRSIFDNATSKTVVSSTEFCECQARHFWPDISSMGKKLKTRIHRRIPEDIEDNSPEVDDSLNEEVFTTDPVETLDD